MVPTFGFSVDLAIPEDTAQLGWSLWDMYTVKRSTACPGLVVLTSKSGLGADSERLTALGK